MINKYFNRPILYDYSLALVIAFITFMVYTRLKFSLPKMDTLVALATDLSTVSLTFAGFVLTLLTVIITFKLSAKVPANADENESISLFDLFFSTALYPMTVRLLKGCIKSLGFISLLGYILKLFLLQKYLIYLFSFDIIALVIITLTFVRSLLILGLITGLQRQ